MRNIFSMFVTLLDIRFGTALVVKFISATYKSKLIICSMVRAILNQIYK